MQLTREAIQGYVDGEAEMREGSRPVWRCGVNSIVMNREWLVAQVKWLAMNRGSSSAERWEKYGMPEVIVDLYNYVPDTIGPGTSGGNRICLRHRHLDRVVIFHPPDGEKLDPTIVAQIA